MTEPHTHGGTDAPECTTCRSQRPPSQEALDLAQAVYAVMKNGGNSGASWHEAGRVIDAALVKAEAPHCPTCACGRRAPIQSYQYPGVRARGTISWAEHLECYAAYAVHHSGQSAERIAERGGFGWDEFVKLTGHEPESWRAL